MAQLYFQPSTFQADLKKPKSRFSRTFLQTKLFAATTLTAAAGDMDETNEIDVLGTLQQIKDNDPSLTHCCFNNIVSYGFRADPVNMGCGLWGTGNAAD